MRKTRGPLGNTEKGQDGTLGSGPEENTGEGPAEQLVPDARAAGKPNTGYLPKKAGSKDGEAGGWTETRSKG